jgi:SNF2 family DNA or RNA helicase
MLLRRCAVTSTVYQENAPRHLLILYNLFSEFLEEIDEDFLPNDRTGYQDSVVWKKLFNYQRDAATGIINKLETYNGCILADSVGLGKRSRRWRWSNTTNCATVCPGPVSQEARG